jgi:hypothetical protein
LDVTPLGQQPQRVLPADGAPGAGAQHGDAAAKLLGLDTLVLISPAR